MLKLIWETNACEIVTRADQMNWNRLERSPWIQYANWTYILLNVLCTQIYILWPRGNHYSKIKGNRNSHMEVYSLQLYQKEFSVQVFSCKFCKILKRFYTEHFGTPAFGEHFSLFCLLFPRLPQHKAEYHFSSFSASLVKKITEVKKKGFYNTYFDTFNRFSEIYPFL